MALQAFVDESLDDSGTFVLAGYVSTPERWAGFSAEWQQALPNACQDKSGRYRFKMSEMARFRERMERVAIFHPIIQKHAMMSVAYVMNARALERAKERLSVDYIDEIRWEEPMTPYYVAFRLFMEHFHNTRVEHPEKIPLDGPVDFFFDDHSEKSHILRGWSDYLSSRPPGYAAPYGAEPRFEDDNEFLPLQAADFRAWWVRRWANEHGYFNIGGGTYTGFTPSTQTMYHLVIAVDEDMLAKTLKSWMEQNLDGNDFFRVRDKKVEQRADAPSPLEVGIERARHWLRGLKRRTGSDQ